MDWLKARNLLAFFGLAFAVHWMVTSEVQPLGSEIQGANLSPRSKMLDQLRREARNLSVRELSGLKKIALSEEHTESERLQAVYKIGLSPKSVSRSFLREIAQAPIQQPIRATALESLRQSDKKFQAY